VYAYKNSKKGDYRGGEEYVKGVKFQNKIKIFYALKIEFKKFTED